MPCVGCDSNNLQDAMREMGIPTQPGRMTRSPWHWRKVQPDVQARIERTLNGALGTPYVVNGRQRGVGLDCRTSLVWFMDTMRRNSEMTPVPEVASDIAVHDVTSAARVVKILIDSFGLENVTERKVIEPGDLIGVREYRDGQKVPAHGLIAGVRTNTAFHAPMPGQAFCQTAIGMGTDIVCVYRDPRKAEWA